MNEDKNKFIKLIRLLRINYMLRDYRLGKNVTIDKDVVREILESPSETELVEMEIEAGKTLPKPANISARHPSYPKTRPPLPPIGHEVRLSKDDFRDVVNQTVKRIENKEIQRPADVFFSLRPDTAGGVLLDASLGKKPKTRGELFGIPEGDVEEENVTKHIKKPKQHKKKLGEAKEKHGYPPLTKEKIEKIRQTREWHKKLGKVKSWKTKIEKL
jgi:hypothetical protein